MAAPTAAAPATDVGSAIQALNVNFVCPETLPNEKLRRYAIDALGRKLSSLRLTYAQAKKVFDTILVLHGCSATSTTQAAPEMIAATR